MKAKTVSFISLHSQVASFGISKIQIVIAISIIGAFYLIHSFIRRLWEEGWRDRYYLHKFGVSKELSGRESYESFRKQVVSSNEFLSV